MAFWCRVLLLQTTENPSSAINPADGPPPHPKKVIALNRPTNSPYSIYHTLTLLPANKSINYAPYHTAQTVKICRTKNSCNSRSFPRKTKQTYNLFSSIQYPASRNSKPSPFAEALILHSPHEVHSGTSQMRKLV